MDRTICIKATAFIIGCEENFARALTDLCQDLKFQTILNFKNLAMAEQQLKRDPICFFLFALECEKRNIPAFARLVRSSRNRQIRFAPMIGFTEIANPKMISACIQLGFDDVILPPFSKKTVRPRLEFQLDKSFTYFETADYFGPDRRISQSGEETQNQKRGLGGDNTKFIISRNLKTGVKIISEQTISQTVQIKTAERIAI